jgi:hypothetical protein
MSRIASNFFIENLLEFSSLGGASQPNKAKKARRFATSSSMQDFDLMEHGAANIFKYSPVKEVVCQGYRIGLRGT